MKRVKLKKQEYTCYIPRNLDIDKFLSDNPPKFLYQRDYFVYIISLIFSIPAHNKDFDLVKSKGFVPINSIILQEKIHEYKDYIKYLLDNNIFVTDNKYSNYGAKSLGYKFSNQYNEKIAIPVKITKYTLIKSIIYNSKPKKETYLPEIPLEEVAYLTKWFNPSLQIDIQGVENCLNQLMEQDKQDPLTKRYAISKFNHRKIEAEKLYIHEYNLSIDRTSGRFHSPLTRLKSELRKFVTYNGKKLISLDLKNSQPFLSLVFTDIELYRKNHVKDIISIYNKKFVSRRLDYSSNPIPSPELNRLEQAIIESSKHPDMAEYRKYVSEGTFYEHWALLSGKYGYNPFPELNIDPRSEAKNDIFQILFSSNTSIGSNENSQWFSSLLGSIYNIFRLVKQGRGHHNTLACTLQFIESQLIIHRVCKTVAENNPEVPLFTIHDSIATTEEYVDYVQQVMQNTIKEAIGFDPMIKKEAWE